MKPQCATIMTNVSCWAILLWLKKLIPFFNFFQVETWEFFSQICTFCFLRNQRMKWKPFLRSYTCSVTANSVSFPISSLNWFASLNAIKDMLAKGPFLTCNDKIHWITIYHAVFLLHLTFLHVGVKSLTNKLCKSNHLWIIFHYSSIKLID